MVPVTFFFPRGIKSRHRTISRLKKMFGRELPEDILKRIITCFVQPHEKHVRIFASRVRTLTSINRAFRRAVEQHEVASSHAFVQLGCLLYRPDQCVRRRAHALKGVVARGSTRDLPVFLEALMFLPRLQKLGLLHVPLLDFTLEHELRWYAWPKTLEHLHIVTEKHAHFVIPGALPPCLRVLVMEGGEGDWVYPAFPETLRRVEFRGSNIQAVPSALLATFPASLEVAVLDLQFDDNDWDTAALARRCPRLRVFSVSPSRAPAAAGCV